jgi:hypothetical protein
LSRYQQNTNQATYKVQAFTCASQYSAYSNLDSVSYRIEARPNAGEFVEISLGKPQEFALYANYPNPFNPSTAIQYDLPEKSFVRLRVFDILGRQVAVLVEEERPAGSYSLSFNASNLPSGIYFYRIEAGSFVETKRMVLLK